MEHLEAARRDRRFNLGDGLILTAGAALSLERLQWNGLVHEIPGRSRLVLARDITSGTLAPLGPSVRRQPPAVAR